VAHILKNRIYVGEIVHKGKAHAGDHEAIVERRLFEAVQARLADHRHRHTTRRTRAAGCPLTGKLFDGDGQPMRPSFGYGRGKKMYRYYVSETLLPNGRIGHADNMRGDRLSAERIERLLLDRLSCLLPTGTLPDDLFAIITRIICTGGRLRICLAASALTADGMCHDMLLGRAQHLVDPDARLVDDKLQLSVDARPTRRGKTVRAKVHILDDPEQRALLADLVRISHRKLRDLNASPLHPDQHCHMVAPTNGWTRARIAIGLLAPDIQKALLQGTAPPNLDPERLLSRDIPLDWDAQRRFLGMMT